MTDGGPVKVVRVDMGVSYVVIGKLLREILADCNKTGFGVSVEQSATRLADMYTCLFWYILDERAPTTTPESTDKPPSPGPVYR